MLSRVAEALYWMSRYLERAENLARILEVNTQLMLDLHPRDAVRLRSDWSPLLVALGLDPKVRGAEGRVDADAVAELLVFEEAGGFSIAESLTAARENARHVREEISDEMWLLLNRTWLWFRSREARTRFMRSSEDFLSHLRGEITEFYGLLESTMEHGDGREFCRVGQFLERADKTTRVLDDKFHLARGRYEMLQWTAVLRMCGARRVYQRKYLSDVTPALVAELLLLDPVFPRSVRFCVAQVDASLRALSGVRPGQFSNEAEQLSGRLLADLCFSSMREFEALGLHQAADDLQGQLNGLGAAVQVAMHGAPGVPAAPALPPVTDITPQQEQQQQ
jgi:uncharacterized alpha-E superfamily protein